MIWALKPEIAAALDESDRENVLRAVNTLTRAKLESGPWEATLTLQRRLCELVQGPPEPANQEPL